MATLGTYYYDSSSFTNATTIYDDADLTTVSQNGWYSDNTIVRQQISGVLYAAQVCATPTPVPTPTAPIPVPVPVAPSPVPSPVAPSPVPAPVVVPVAPSPSPVPVPVAPVPTPTAPVPAPVVVPSPVPVPVPVPTPTAPVPAPVVQSGASGGYYGDFSNFCTATQLYTDTFCTQLAPSGYYTAFSSNEVRFWTGIAFQDSCQTCQ
jgi:hypothetical protein